MHINTGNIWKNEVVWLRYKWLIEWGRWKDYVWSSSGRERNFKTINYIWKDWILILKDSHFEPRFPLAPKRCLAMSGDIFLYDKWRNTTFIQWVEAKNAIQHLIISKTTPQQEWMISPIVNGAKIAMLE